MRVKSSHTFAYTIVKPFGWVRAQSANFFLGGFASFADSALRGSFELRGASAAATPSVVRVLASMRVSPIACASALRLPSTSWASISPPSGRRLRSCRRGATAKGPARPMRAPPNSCDAVPLRQHYPPPACPRAQGFTEPAAPGAIVTPHCRCARRRVRLQGQAAGPPASGESAGLPPIAPCPCESCESQWPRRTPSTLRCLRSTPS